MVGVVFSGIQMFRSSLYKMQWNWFPWGDSSGASLNSYQKLAIPTCIHQSAMWSFPQPVVTSWRIMAVRVQMDQIKFEEFIFEFLESMTNSSTTYKMIQSAIEQLPRVVTRCLFHASSASEYAQLCPEDAIILQFCVPWQCDIMKYSSIEQMVKTESELESIVLYHSSTKTSKMKRQIGQPRDKS